MAKQLGPYAQVVSGLKRGIVGGLSVTLPGITSDGVVVRARFGAIPKSLDEDVIVEEMSRQAEVGIGMAKADKTGGTLKMTVTGPVAAEQFGHEPTAKARGLAKTAKQTSDNGAPVPVGAAS